MKNDLIKKLQNKNYVRAFGLMTNDLIKKLQNKNYVRAFGLMTPEEQECFKKAGKKNCMWYYSDVWQTNSLADASFSQHITYAIKPAYRPEPELRKNRKLAVKITEQLYTMYGAGPNGENVIVERMALMKAREHSHEELLGGLCINSAEALIEKLLDEAT